MSVQAKYATVHEIIIAMKQIRILRKETLVKMEFSTNFIARDAMTRLIEDDPLNEIDDGPLMLIEGMRESIE